MQRAMLLSKCLQAYVALRAVYLVPGMYAVIPPCTRYMLIFILMVHTWYEYDYAFGVLCCVPLRVRTLLKDKKPYLVSDDIFIFISMKLKLSVLSYG